MAAVSAVLRDLWTRFLARLRASSTTDSSALGPVDPVEVVVRFALESNKLKKQSSTIFLPDRRGETSVYRSRGLDEAAIWSLGATEVASPGGRSLRGRADVVAQSALDIGLSVVAEISEHPRHANIVGWPSEKSAQKELALRLAQASEFRISAG